MFLYPSTPCSCMDLPRVQAKDLRPGDLVVSAGLLESEAAAHPVIRIEFDADRKSVLIVQPKAPVHGVGPRGMTLFADGEVKVRSNADALISLAPPGFPEKERQITKADVDAAQAHCEGRTES